jgi:hypothetical protein
MNFSLYLARRAHVALQHVMGWRWFRRSILKGIPMTPSFSPIPAAQWTRLWLDGSRFWADATMVMMLRSWRMMAGGRPAQREAERMVSEKVEAGAELAGALAGGRVKTPAAAARKAVSVYGKRVRANRKRLG